MLRLFFLLILSLIFVFHFLFFSFFFFLFKFTLFLDKGFLFVCLFVFWLLLLLFFLFCFLFLFKLALLDKKVLIGLPCLYDPEWLFSFDARDCWNSNLFLYVENIGLVKFILHFCCLVITLLGLVFSFHNNNINCVKCLFCLLWTFLT